MTLRSSGFRDLGYAYATYVLASGHPLIFIWSGKLLVSGGIFGARGHEGDNAGSVAVIALAAGRDDCARTDTFGWPLFEATDQPGWGRAACLR